VHSSNEDYDFESLIQVATEGSMGYPLGGDFAGLAATFNPGDGSFIPIPDYLIPESLKEWGQEPKCLEVLVSEEVEEDGMFSSDDTVKNSGGSRGTTLTRITTTILPDTGCGVDNLETIVAEDQVDLESQWTNLQDEDMAVHDDDADGIASATNVVGLQYPIGDSNELRLETIFGLEDATGQYRMRVAIDLVPSPPDTFGLQSPMVLTLERRTSSISSRGTIAEGGGLDGKTVSMLLGERLRGSKTFVDEPVTSVNYVQDSIVHVPLPGNISIAYGWVTDHDWTLQVGHVGQSGMRRVVSRTFTVTQDGELDFEIQSWVEDPQEVTVP